MGVRSEIIETHSQYILSHKNALSIICVGPKGSNGWTDMFRAAAKGRMIFLSQMDDSMNLMMGEAKWLIKMNQRKLCETILCP